MTKPIKPVLSAVVLLAGLGFAGQAEARGCIKGALVGGLAGHAAGHTFAGAAAGCVAGRALANRSRNRAQQDRDLPPNRRPANAY